jgi:ketosteroid isomerase-like protein
MAVLRVLNWCSGFAWPDKVSGFFRLFSKTDQEEEIDIHATSIRTRGAMRVRLKHLLAGGAMTLAVSSLPASAQPGDEAQSAIRAALLNWATYFNTGDAERACGLFAADLRYDYRGAPERRRADMCSLLQRSLGDKTRRFHYSPEIKEIIVSGRLAIVRIVWTLTVTPVDSTGNATGNNDVTKEFGLDVFQKQPDGVWKITRFLAYDAP